MTPAAPPTATAGASARRSRRPPYDPDDPYRSAPGGGGGQHFRSAEPDEDDDDGDDDDGPLLSRRGNPRRTRGQRALLGLLVFLVLVFVAAAGVAGYTVNKYESIERVRDIKIAEAPKGEPQNFLLVGSDTREGTADAAEVGGQRSDTIMVLRVDPESDRLSIVSFPRDLMLDIPALGRRGQINSAYELENGEQALIDTINQNFGIPINHYVEVNFNGFKQLTDAIGGVNLFFPNAVRDDQTGLFVETLGCVNLNGEQALAFARSRHLEYRAPEGWRSDLYADLSRVQRQQIFIRRALTKTLADVKSNPLRIQQLIDIGVGNVRLDGDMGVGDILDLANQFKSFSADKLETYPLPVLDDPTNRNRVIVDATKADPILNVFRGLDPGEVSAERGDGQGPQRHRQVRPRQRRLRRPPGRRVRDAGGRRLARAAAALGRLPRPRRGQPRPAGGAAPHRRRRREGAGRRARRAGRAGAGGRLHHHARPADPDRPDAGDHRARAPGDLGPADHRGPHHDRPSHHAAADDHHHRQQRLHRRRAPARPPVLTGGR